jgi:hypothetical protein
MKRGPLRKIDTIHVKGKKKINPIKNDQDWDF